MFFVLPKGRLMDFLLKHHLVDVLPSPTPPRNMSFRSQLTRDQVSGSWGCLGSRLRWSMKTMAMFRVGSPLPLIVYTNASLKSV